MPSALVLRTAGTNCNEEMARAFALAGAAVSTLHLDTLIAEPARLDEFDLVGFPGGFSYGDDIASGRIFAMRVRERLYPALREAAARGAMVLGACNGFQVLVQVGLLPGPAAGEEWPQDAPPPQRLALADNAGARFVDRWVGVRVEPGNICLWTRGLDDGSYAPEAMQLPVAHGEGRLIADSPALLDDLARAGQIVLRYTDNYNGSDRAIAGVCDPSGRVFALMPHPERYLDWTRHPQWTRLPSAIRSGPTPGLRIFQNAVEAVARTPV